MDRTINILGTEYKVIEDESLTDEGCDGKVSVFDPVIRIRPYRAMLDSNDSDSEKKACYRETMRHEVIHAAFKETGNEDYMSDERLVQILAVLFPKLNRIFGELGVQA